MTIASLKQQGAKIAAWASGDSIAAPDPTGIVWKLCAIEDGRGGWRDVVKLSKQAVKTSIPGDNELRRYRDSSGHLVCDLIVPPGTESAKYGVDPTNENRELQIDPEWSSEKLLRPIIQKGDVIEEAIVWPDQIRQFVRSEVQQLTPDMLRKVNPASPPVFVTDDLMDRRRNYARELRRGNQLESCLVVVAGMLCKLARRPRQLFRFTAFLSQKILALHRLFK